MFYVHEHTGSMSADDRTQEGEGLTQEMAMEYMDAPVDYDMRRRTLDDADNIHRLGPNYRYAIDETNPEAAYIVHVRHTEPYKKGDEDLPLPVLIRVGTLGRVLDTKAAHFREKANTPATPLFDRLLSEIQDISPGGGPSPAPRPQTPSPQVDILRAASATDTSPPGTPMGQGGKRL